LGEWVFPPDIIDEFRRRGVEHVVLTVDPSLGSLPFLALKVRGQSVLDEPWSLSLVTASTELIRLYSRIASEAPTSGPLHWFGPDPDVNARLGGDSELARLNALYQVQEHREANATLEKAVETLSSGGWLHFCGHGRWRGSIDTTGPVFARSECLSSASYDRIRGQPGFLFTAACLTASGEAVGTEVTGSLVDYDRAGLLGAVLTNWPIHGPSAVLFVDSFYTSLNGSGDAAQALKSAAREIRNRMPHPYLWAPFSLWGAWNVGNLLEQRQYPEQHE
jgi:CHAT domain-containing protein